MMKEQKEWTFFNIWLNRNKYFYFILFKTRKLGFNLLQPQGDGLFLSYAWLQFFATFPFLVFYGPPSPELCEFLWYRYITSS